MSALQDALALGIGPDEIVATIIGTERRMFFKSMTTHADYRLGQDVYNVPSKGIVLYLKFQADVVAAFKVMSFRET